MAKMSLGDFHDHFGIHTAIAALAVIVEDEAKDKLRSPGAREKKHLLCEHEEAGEVAFSVVGDIAKAHRRFKHAAKEHGYLACQVDAEEETPGDPASQTVFTLTSWVPSGSPALATGGRASLPVALG